MNPETIKVADLDTHSRVVREHEASGFRIVSETTFGKTYRRTILGRGMSSVYVVFDPDDLLGQKPGLVGLLAQADALDPPIQFATRRVKPLAELTALDVPRGIDPEDVATDYAPESKGD